MKNIMTISDNAEKKIFDLINNTVEYENSNSLKLRVYITGGGCGGFQYVFILDNTVNDGDYFVEKNGVILLVVDCLSSQYLLGSCIDYYEDLDGSRFIISNPNAVITCSCGSSFNI